MRLMPADPFQQTFFVFQSPTDDLYAISSDKTGANINPIVGSSAWLLRGEIDRADIDPDNLLTIIAKGFCVLTADEMARKP
jgi:hypothetical protein